MEIVIISVVAFFASLLTFFSGFGLGTILTPVFILFFPIEIAISLTGIVHFLNNIFKLLLTYKNINWEIAFRFSVTAIIFSLLGAWLLTMISGDMVIAQYTLFHTIRSITLIKLVMALLMAVFVILEIHPALNKIAFGKDKIMYGGALSGFFGGLAGFQGALRSMFLIKCGLAKESFISTGIFIACMIDITRLTAYFGSFSQLSLKDNSHILFSSVIAAFAGAFLGSKLLQKVTYQTVQYLVSILLIFLALLLGFGIL